jgi:hypothetical protein
LIALEESDGLASEKDGVVVKPYLEFQEAIDELESFTQGQHEVLTSPQKATYLSF